MLQLAVVIDLAIEGDNEFAVSALSAGPRAEGR
jgi:hypothetical protein